MICHYQAYARSDFIAFMSMHVCVFVCVRMCVYSAGGVLTVGSSPVPAAGNVSLPAIAGRLMISYSTWVSDGLCEITRGRREKERGRKRERERECVCV